MTISEYLDKIDATENGDTFIEQRIMDRISELPTLIPASRSIHCYHCNKDRDRTYTFYYAWDNEADSELFEGGFDYQLACSDCIDERVKPLAEQDLEDLKDKHARGEV